jgi:hypothetical protein
MNLKDFDMMLEHHDWYYNYSDDGGVWRAGEQAQDRLIKTSKESSDHLKLFESWSKHYFSGEPWNTPHFSREELNAVRSSMGVV